MFMMTISAAVAAASPVQAAAPQPRPTNEPAQMQHVQMAEKGEHKKMDCCECCKDMAKHEEGHGEHSQHTHQ